MAVTWVNNKAASLLYAMLRATYQTNGVIDAISLKNEAETQVVKYKTNIAASDWTGPSGGKVTLITPLAMSHGVNDTITKASLGPTGLSEFLAGLVAGLSGGKDLVIDDAVITAAEACNITDFRMTQPLALGTVKINLALSHQILKYFTKKDTAHFSAAGAIDVYDGSAPSSADDAATGTKLISFATTTSTWNDPSASVNSCTLASSLTASGIATGTAGYARFSWTVGGVTFVIQGSIGTTGTDFVISSTSIVNGNSFNLTAATIGF